VNLVSELEVEAQQRISLDCEAEGNPQPSYSWTPCYPQHSVCNQSMLHVQASDRSVYKLTCRVENCLGSDTKNITLCKLAKEKKVFPAFLLTVCFHENVVIRTYITGRCNLL